MFKAKTILMMFVLSCLLFNTVTTTYAATTVHVNLSFPGSISDSVGNTWTTNGTVTYSTANRIDLKNASLTATLAGFSTSLQANEDWYIRNKFRINSGWAFQLIKKVDGGGWDLLVSYDRGTGKWTVVLANAGGVNTTYVFNDSLSTGTDYDVVFTRDGGDLKYYRDGDLKGSLPIGITTRGRAAAPFEYGDTGSGDITVERVQIIGGKAFRMVDAKMTSLSVIGTDISLTAPALNFSTVIINNSAATNSTAIGTIMVSDERGTGEGWSLKVKATDLQTASLPDPSSGGVDTFVLKIPVSAISIAAPTITKTAGQDIHATYGPVSSAITLSNSPQTIANATPGYGMGNYNIVPTLTLSVPKTVQVASKSGTSSKHNVGDSIGTVAASYTGTITFTIGAGI